MPSLRITNLPQFEAQLQSNIGLVSSKVSQVLTEEALAFFNKLPETVADSKEFLELQRSEELRGKLGLAAPGRGAGSDTGPEDLLNILRQYKVVKTRGTGGPRFASSIRKLSIIFPSINEFEEKLIHNLSRFRRGAFTPGQTVSWFRWWEFGDQGEIDTLTVTPQNAGVVANRFSRTTGVDRVLNAIKRVSRSGFAMQAVELEADGDSHIVGRGLISKVYADYLNRFPRHMAKVFRQFGINPKSFFAGARGIIR